MRSETGIKDLLLGNLDFEIKTFLAKLLLYFTYIRYIYVLSTKVIF